MNNKFFNRELSWIEFNARVLEKACNKEIPLLERIKFLSIVSSNFDEFFMVRVADLKRHQNTNSFWKDISNLTVDQQLEKISKRVHQLYKTQYDCLNNDILPSLKQHKISYISVDEFSLNDKIFTEKYFRENIFPLLTPLKVSFSNNTKITNFSNLKLHVAFMLSPLVDSSIIPPAFKPPENEIPLAFVQLPSGVNRILWLPEDVSDKENRRFTLLDDLLIKYGTQLFPGYNVEQSMIFRVTCDAAFTVDEQRDNDFILAMEEVLQARKTSLPVRLTCNNSSALIKEFLIKHLNLTQDDVYEVEGIIDLSSLSHLSELSNTENLKYSKWKPCIPKEFDENHSIWDEIKKQDLMLHTPYDSFEPVVKMINEAATDPKVLAIKITLYRTSGNSPIVKALELAARNGKQVTVFIELKARFDEKQNIEWATRLQNAGVIVIYGIVNLKLHAKMMIIVRKEDNEILRYVHLSTGNYNENTAKLYSDISIFTAEPEIANDATLFFNMISGYSALQTMQKIKIAPINLKSNLISLIEREIQNSSPEKPGLIIAKMNSLAHPEVIQALYKASCANVKIKLNVRGICMLVPGVKNLSENIQVTSIIDRYLEHSRICYFQNGGDEEIYLSSADWMPRNLDRRVEIMFPILSKSIFTRIKSILNTYLEDTENTSILNSDGSWSKILNSQTEKTEKKFSAQKHFHELAKTIEKSQKENLTGEFVVRR